MKRKSLKLNLGRQVKTKFNLTKIYARLVVITLFLGNSIFFTLSPAVAAATYSFTNAGATGRNGPTQAQVDTAYSGTSLSAAVTINTRGIQEWTVPASGNYRIEAAGAKGGNGGGGVGGNGAFVSIDISLVAGTKYSIVVGQMGISKTSGAVYPGGGGGGGTFMYTTTGIEYVLAVAGGGGGPTSTAALTSSLSNAHGKADSTSGTTISIGSSFSAAGGTGGSGGSASSRGAVYGGPGAGITSDGGGNSSINGKTRVNGWLGGTPGTNGANGGFGGGGAASDPSGNADWAWPGGAGGYSGGGGGGNSGSGDGDVAMGRIRTIRSAI